MVFQFCFDALLKLNTNKDTSSSHLKMFIHIQELLYICYSSHDQEVVQLVPANNKSHYSLKINIDIQNMFQTCSVLAGSCWVMKTSGHFPIF